MGAKSCNEISRFVNDASLDLAKQAALEAFEASEEELTSAYLIGNKLGPSLVGPVAINIICDTSVHLIEMAIGMITNLNTSGEDEEVLKRIKSNFIKAWEKSTGEKF